MRTLFVILLSVAPFLYAGAQTGDSHPPVGKYYVYRFEGGGNAVYAFDFTLIRKSSQNKTGLYELEIGKDGKDKSQSSGEYQYNADTKTIIWLSGPFATSEQYKQGPNNRDAGKVIQKGNAFTIILNNSLRGSTQSL